MLENLESDKIACISKAMYQLAVLQDLVVHICETFTSISDSKGQRLVLHLCAFLCLGATFSPKLRQLLSTVLEYLQSPTNLTPEDNTAFRILLAYELDVDDRKQVHLLVKNLLSTSTSPELKAMLVRSVISRHISSKPHDPLNQDALSKLESHISSESSKFILERLSAFDQTLYHLRTQLEASVVNLCRPTKPETSSLFDEQRVAYH
jgi:hypothetical protein